MISLIYNVLVLLIGVGGSIVSALALPNTVWRKRIVLGFAVMGTVGLVLTIISYEQTPDVPHLSDMASSATAAFVAFSRNHSWFWPALFLFIGLGVGICFGMLICKRSHRERVDPTPRVRKWLEPVEAIQAFVDAKLISEWKRARDQAPRLAAEIDHLKKIIDERQSAGLSNADIGGGLEILSASAEMGSLMTQRRQAIDRLNKAGEESWKKEKEVLVDLINQLKRGTLVGKGFRHRMNRVADTAGIIPLDQWQLLNFETYDQKRQTVEGGGKKYVGLQIGRNENPPP